MCGVIVKIVWIYLVDVLLNGDVFETFLKEGDERTWRDLRLCCAGLHHQRFVGKSKSGMRETCTEEKCVMLRLVRERVICLRQVKATDHFPTDI